MSKERDIAFHRPKSSFDINVAIASISATHQSLKASPLASPPASVSPSLAVRTSSLPTTLTTTFDSEERALPTAKSISLEKSLFDPPIESSFLAMPTTKEVTCNNIDEEEFEGDDVDSKPIASFFPSTDGSVTASLIELSDDSEDEFGKSVDDSVSSPEYFPTQDKKKTKRSVREKFVELPNCPGKTVPRWAYLTTLAQQRRSALPSAAEAIKKTTYQALEDEILFSDSDDSESASDVSYTSEEYDHLKNLKMAVMSLLKVRQSWKTVRDSIGDQFRSRAARNELERILPNQKSSTIEGKDMELEDFLSYLTPEDLNR